MRPQITVGLDKSNLRPPKVKIKTFFFLLNHPVFDRNHIKISLRDYNNILQIFCSTKI